MRDPRIDEYARLLVDRSLGVQPGWQVVVRSTPLARPLVDAVQEQIARRGAFPFLQLAWDQFGGPFVREAPLEVLAEPGADPAPHVGDVRRLHLDLGPGERAGGSRPLGRAPGAAAEAPRAAPAPADGDGCAVGDLRVPDQRCRPGGRADARGVRGVRLRRRPARLGRRARADVAGSPRSSTGPTRCESSATGPT